MKIFMLFVLCYTLFFLQQWEQNHTFSKFYSPSPRPQFLNDRALKSKPYFKNQAIWALADALITGNQKNMDKGEKKKFKELNLNHLFSPSGLHFSSILFPLNPIIKSFPVLNIILLLGFIPLFFTQGLFSLKRSLLFLNISFFNRSFLKFSTTTIFVLVFVISFLVGDSFQSFIFSLLFWGIFILEKKLIRRLIYLFLAQYLCCCFFPSNFYPLSIPCNLFISLFFTLSFPIILFNFFIPNKTFIFTISETVLETLTSTVAQFHQFIIKTPMLCPSHILLWSLILFVFFPKKRLGIIILSIGLVSMPTNSKDDLRIKFEARFLKRSIWKAGD